MIFYIFINIRADDFMFDIMIDLTSLDEIVTRFVSFVYRYQRG